MKKLFYLVLVVFLANIAFLVLINSGSANFTQQGISAQAEAATLTEPNNLTGSSSKVFADRDVNRAYTISKMADDNDREDINKDPAQEPIFDQQADVSLSVHILQMLSSNTLLSGKAANVKVASVDGSVIVHGTAQSEEDRSVIIRQIDNVAGVDRIDDHLRIVRK